MIPRILKVTEPCTENWDKMTPNEKGRFCDSCQKTVIDFTEMSASEISGFLKNHSGALCGRIMGKSQMFPALVEDKTERNNYFPFPGRNIAATALLTTGLAFITPISNNVESPSIENIQIHNQPKKDSDKKQLVPVDNDEFIIKGRITPNSKKLRKIGIANAKVSLLTKEKEYCTYTDANGDFQLVVPKDIIRDKNVIYFSYDKITSNEKFEKNNEYGFFGFDSEFNIFTKEQIENPINELAELNVPIAGGIGFGLPSYLINGQLLSFEEMENIWETERNNKSCNVETSNSFILYGEAANIIAGQEIEGDLIVQYDSTENLEDTSVF